MEDFKESDIRIRIKILQRSIQLYEKQLLSVSSKADSNDPNHENILSQIESNLKQDEAELLKYKVKYPHLFI